MQWPTGIALFEIIKETAQISQTFCTTPTFPKLLFHKEFHFLVIIKRREFHFIQNNFETSSQYVSDL
jgi:hypothetical protein